jgi:hypothetical protein
MSGSKPTDVERSILTNVKAGRAAVEGLGEGKTLALRAARRPGSTHARVASARGRAQPGAVRGDAGWASGAGDEAMTDANTEQVNVLRGCRDCVELEPSFGAVDGLVEYGKEAYPDPKERYFVVDAECHEIARFRSMAVAAVIASAFNEASAAGLLWVLCPKHQHLPSFLRNSVEPLETRP